MTALAEPKTNEDEKPGGLPVPKDIKDRVKRGREAMKKDAALRELCVRFWKGDHYSYLNTQRQLRSLTTALVDESGQKPAHRIRNTYNYVQSIVEAKVSAASQRIPGYEIDPSSTDQDDISGARIAQQIAFWGYDDWYVRRHSVKTITNALVQREGFVMPFFDSCIGPFKPGPDGVPQGMGNVRLVDYTRSEVMWEPGVDFLESRWHATDQAMLPDEVRQIPGYIGGALKKDAKQSSIPDGKKSDEMALVTVYMERPSPKYPMGRRCWVHDDRIIVDFRQDPEAPEGADWWEPFPYMDATGQVIDEPCLHRLSYTVNPEGDDMGLVERLIDLMRTINDCWNKILEWKNRCLMPQFMAPNNSLTTNANDIPGFVYRYNLMGAAKPEPIPTPPIPRELFQILESAIQQLRDLASDVVAAPDPNLAAATLNASIEQNQARWQSFMGDVAEFHSRLMRHCLTLVARYFTDERIIAIRGQYGWEPVISFRGQDMNSQTNVRVLPGSLESRTKAQIQQQIEFIQTNWPGAITPEAAMAAINGGTGENLLKSYALDVEGAWRTVQTFRQGPDVVLMLPDRNDPDLGPVPSWMPRPWDNIAIYKQVVGDYMKTDDWYRLDPPTQEIFNLFWSGLEWLEGARAQQLALRQQGTAQMLGMENAARPQTPIPTPQQQPLTPQRAAPNALSPR